MFLYLRAVLTLFALHESIVLAKQEIDYGRRGKGYIFGAFRPATGAALIFDEVVTGFRIDAANCADLLAAVIFRRWHSKKVTK